MRGTLIERFWPKVNKDGPIPTHMPHLGKCWVWVVKIFRPRNYGIISLNGRDVRANRASWMIHFGDIPEGKYVCHKCDNTLCVNPSHLFIGDAQTNTDDMISKGRFARHGKRGESNYSAKLKEFDVRKIKSLIGIIPVKAIAKAFQINKNYVYDINSGKKLAHLKLPKTETALMKLRNQVASETGNGRERHVSEFIKIPKQ